MFNYRIVIAQVKLLKDIFLIKNKDYAAYAEIITTYDGPFKALASWLIARDFDKPQTDDIIGHLIPYIKKGRLKTDEIIVSPSAVKIKNSEPFQELTDFVNYVHGHFPTALPTKKVENQFTERTPVISGQGIQIYEVNNPNDSRELAGDTSWCIAYPGQNNMWTSYRSVGASSFFIVFDENPPSPELRKVAVDFNLRGVDLTDINNNTGATLPNGMDWDEYSGYLEEKGINIQAKRTNPESGEEENILKNKPLTDEEKFFLQYYNLYKSKNNLTVEQVQKWARGIVELEPDQSEKRQLYEPPDLFLEEIKIPNKEEKSLNIVFRRLNQQGYGRATILPIKREQILSLKYKNSGASYALENTAQTNQDLFDGKSGNLNSLQFGEYEKTEPLAEIKLKLYDAKKFLTKFVGLGYILPNEVFDYVMGLPDGRELLIQYVDTGITIPEEQIEKIKAIPALFKTYARKQLISISRNTIQDASILKHLSPNDEETRNSVLETLIPKDIKNVYSTEVDSIINNLRNIPTEWLNIPQIGILFNPRTNYKDQLAIKVSLAMGIANYFQDNPTLENALIYLHDTEAINSFKDEAIAQKYLPAIFEPFFNIEEYNQRWKKIQLLTPDLVNEPRLNKFRAFGLGLNYAFVTEPGGNEDPQLTYERVAIVLIRRRYIGSEFYKNDINFWLYFINNYNNLLNTVFKNVGYEHTQSKFLDDNGNEVEEDDRDENEEYEEIINTTYDRDEQKNRFYNTLKKLFPTKILEKPEIIKALETNFSENEVIEIIKSQGNYSEILYDYLSKSINSFSDLHSRNHNDIFTKDNPIIRKLTQNGLDVDDFMKKFVYRPFSNHIFELSKWNPGLVESISDSDFFKILQREKSLPQSPYTFSDIHILWLEQNRPEVLVKLFKENPDSLFPHHQRLYITQNVLPKIKQPEQIEEPKIEEPVPTPEPELLPEEPITASVKLMVKIAKKLDNKNKYKLADKFTNILRKYNV